MPGEIPDILVQIKVEAYGRDRDAAIAAVRSAVAHLVSGFNGGHGHTTDNAGRYVVQYDDGSDDA